MSTKKFTIDPARLCLKSVRLEPVERGKGFDKAPLSEAEGFSPNGVNTSPCRINNAALTLAQRLARFDSVRHDGEVMASQMADAEYLMQNISSDKTTSHSTRLHNNRSQVAGYPKESEKTSPPLKRQAKQ